MYTLYKPLGTGPITDLSMYLSMCLCFYVSIIYVSMYLCVYLSTYL